MAYLKAIRSSKESSSDKSISASTASGGRSSTDPCNALLQKIKAKIFDVDMFFLLERDSLTSFALKELLKQAEVLELSPEVSEVIMELGLMIDQVVVDINCVRNTLTTINSKS